MKAMYLPKREGFVIKRLPPWYLARLRASFARPLPQEQKRVPWWRTCWQKAMKLFSRHAKGGGK